MRCGQVHTYLPLDLQLIATNFSHKTTFLGKTYLWNHQILISPLNVFQYHTNPMRYQFPLNKAFQLHGLFYSFILQTLLLLVDVLQPQGVTDLRFLHWKQVIYEYELFFISIRYYKWSDLLVRRWHISLRYQSQDTNQSNYGLRMRRECRERFPRHLFQRKPLISDPGMRHGTCVTHVPWCMSGSLTRGGGENVPGVCTTRNFTYLVGGPLQH